MTNQEKLDSAIKTLQSAKSGIESLISFVKQDENFTKAVNLILENKKGRAIVSGMGKSGHIANKIAATLASTGTPAFFIHPGEASHGDLGMITKEDVVILLSNSGETKELKDIIYYCKRFEIPIIGIIRRKESQLSQISDVPLVLPDIKEGNLVNAPTTSTTMMIAIGDALAISLMDQKQFKNDQYGIFHPGGKLGAAFIKVKDLMHKNQAIPLTSSQKLMPTILMEITTKRLGCTGVTNKQGELIGIITDGDLRRNISSNMLKSRADQIMSKNPQTINQDELVTTAINIMNSKKITSLFVTKDDACKKIIGIIHIHDCLNAGAA